MTTKQVSTFCRICEPQCGIYAHVKEGKFIGVSANTEHVSSRGHYCKKSASMVDLVYDKDRVLYPLKRDKATGKLSRISWDQAYEEITTKLKKIQKAHGKESVATYLGNPPYYSYKTILWHELFTRALGIKWKYHVHAEDGGALIATNSLLYGSGGLIALPDLWHTDFLLIIGANPVVSHGSSFSEPRSGSALKKIKERGGKIVVVDPRYNETAVGNEHISINAGSDAYLAASMIHELIKQDLVDVSFIWEYTRDYRELVDAVSLCTADWASEYTGIPAEKIKTLATEFGTAKSAAIHSRMGASAQRFGSLTTLLLNIIPIITGNLDRRGGMLFSAGLIDAEGLAGKIKVGLNPSRVDGLPDVMGQLPSTALVNDIKVDGKGQVKALFMIGANPALASPASGGPIEEALEELSLFVSQDVYQTESNKYADYILPAATWPEVEGIPFIAMATQLRPNIYASKPVIDKQGEVKEDWEIMQGIGKHLGLGGAYPFSALKWASKLGGWEFKPRHLLNLLIRVSKHGDLFGLRPKGLNLEKIENSENGVSLRKDLPIGVLKKKLETKDKRIGLAPAEMKKEIEKLRVDSFYMNDKYPLRLIGMRQKSSHNSWMHNISRLAKDHQEHVLFIHKLDAKPRGLEDQDRIEVMSAHGKIYSTIRFNSSLKPGTVCMPHGWGHDGSWKLANSIAGCNSNILASPDPRDADGIAGMTTLNGIPVQVSKLSTQATNSSANSITNKIGVVNC